MDIVARLQADQPVLHSGGTVRWDSLPQTLETIERLVHDGDHTLETGCGVSTIVFTACGAFHTAISPDEREHARVRAYCTQIGVDDSRLTFVAGLSDQVLPSLSSEAERTLDAAFIDGAHSFPYPMIDWHYISRLLKVGGTLLIDDLPIPAVAPLFRHMSLESNWRLDTILDDRAAAFTLLAEPDPEDGSLQPFNRRYWDYSFASFPLRAKLAAAHRAGRLRRRLAQRYPGLRRRWNRFTGEAD